MTKDKGQVYYTLVHLDGTKETIVASIKDVYVLLREEIDILRDKIEFQKMDIDFLRSENKLNKWLIYLLCITCMLSPAIAHWLVNLKENL